MKYFNNYLKSIIRTGQDLKSLGPVQLTLASVNAWSYASELDGSEFEADGTWNIMLQAMHWPIKICLLLNNKMNANGHPYL